jgi:flagellar P-ring protein precursor FlgI
MKFRVHWHVIVAFAVAFLGGVRGAEAVRIKDVAQVQGVRQNQLLGYGLVIGLQGTGDVGQMEFTIQSTVSLLARYGIRVSEGNVLTRNVAAVMVTAELPPFARIGQRVNVNVASLGNARSLEGGVLLMTPLRGADGEVYALAQGGLAVGGYDARADRRTREVRGQTNAGMVVQGAIVERELDTVVGMNREVRFVLHQPDFATSVQIAERINEAFGGAATEQGGATDEAQGRGLRPVTGEVARSVDSATVVVRIPEPFAEYVSQFIALIEELEVQPDAVARVVANERTGTVVLNGRVRMSAVAVSHGTLTVRVDGRVGVSQPLPFGAGQTVVVEEAGLEVRQTGGSLVGLAGTETLDELISALNALGTTPRDLISILHAIHAAGALHAEFVVQ